MDFGNRSSRVHPCVIIADDLTGACDTGVHFAHEGFETVVHFQAPCSNHLEDVPVFNTQIRASSRPMATKVAAQTVAMAPDCGVLYKKIDSTLHGHIAAELEVSLQGNRTSAVFAPAYPAMGRTVRDGVLTAVGCEPVDIGSVLPSSLSRAGSPEEAVERPGSVYVPDIESTEQLRALAAAALPYRDRLLFVGSGGLALHIACALATEARVLPKRPEPVVRSHPKVVFFLGSHNPVTLRQAERLRRSGLACETMAVQLEAGSGPCPTWRVAMGSARAAVFCGGDTAQLVCCGLGVRGMRLQAEIVPGVPWSILAGAEYDGMPVATKAGGFGSDDALVRVAEFFLNR
jgi:uncharacterized protein YgbK (DUF1537 family)